jgi:hypothetical protein
MEKAQGQKSGMLGAPGMRKWEIFKVAYSNNQPFLFLIF